MRAFIVVAILVGTASAESRVGVRFGESLQPRDTSTLVRLRGVENATLDHATIALRSDSTSVRATVRFRLSTRAREAHDLRVPIELSSGTAVTGLTYSVGGEPKIEATMHPASPALDAYTITVRDALDPALLAWTASNELRDTYELAVFPVSRGMPANVEIELVLPNATKLVFDPGPQAKQRSFALPTIAESGMVRDPKRELAVDEWSSLYAGDTPPPPPAIVHREQLRPTVSFTDRRYELRKQVRGHATQLRHCYELGVLLEPTLSPSAKLALDVGPAGGVSNVSVTGEMARNDIRGCIADEVASWTFSAATDARTVRQEIDLLHLD